MIHVNVFSPGLALIMTLRWHRLNLKFKVEMRRIALLVILYLIFVKKFPVGFYRQICEQESIYRIASFIFNVRPYTQPFI